VYAPKLFKSESLARRFLNSQAPRPWLKGLKGQERRERIQAWKKRREEALHKWIAEGRKPLGFPDDLRIIKNKDQGWEDPVPVVGISSGTKCSSRSFSEFLPATEIFPATQDMNDLLNRIFDGMMPDYTCLLAEQWLFGEMEKDAMKRVGHQFEGRKHKNVVEIVLKSLYDFEHSLSLFHPNASCEAIAKFWTSWNVQRHLAEFTERIKESPTVLSLTREPRTDARSAGEQMKIELAVYAHEISPAKSAEETADIAAMSRTALVRRYRSRFKEKILVLDICWAAEQYYSEWKRWLRAASPIKDGSKPDMAFRAVLGSGKKPSEYRKQSRPSGWK